MNRRLLAAVLLALGAAAPESQTNPLLDSLQRARTEQQAAALEQQISVLWRAEISPSVQLLADRAAMSLAHQDARTAIADLDAALDLQTDQASLWRLHAEARFANGDDQGAYADLAQALARQPRCFPALADMSAFAEARGDYKRALEAWQAMLAMDPNTPHGRKRLEVLQRHVSGEPL